MVQSILRWIFSLMVVLLLIGGCAKISSPSGGPRDKEPPVVLKSTPEPGAKNFTGKRISITFDEYVVLDKISEKFMVSPPMEKKPEVYRKGKNVVVEYEDTLRDSTTYTFNFQDAIRDLNEGNIIENYQFVFSTGSVIDSLSVTGNVYEGSSLNPPEATLILLYSNLADSAVSKSIPDYISRADKNGYFRIDNIRAGKYRLYALKDADNSKNLNLPDEEFAFMGAPIDVSAEKNYLPVIKDTVKVPKTGKTVDTTILKGEHKLILFLPERKQHYLTSTSRSTQKKLTYTLSMPPDSLGFDFSIPGVDAKSYFLERSAENDTLLVWLRDSSLYSQSQIITLVRYPFTDTTGKIVQKEDTLRMRFLKPQAIRGKTRAPLFSVNTNFSGGKLIPGQQIVLESQTPFRDPDTSKIRIYEISGKEKINIPFFLIKNNTNSCQMTMDVKLVQGKNYLYVADSAAFGNIYGEQADSSGIKFLIPPNESFGKLTVTVKNYQGNRIIQLLAVMDEKVLREKQMDKDGKVEFPFLNEGRYKLRVIYDLDGNGKWTTGDFEKGRQPEPVSFFPQEIEIKQNWEIDQDWDISEQNIKKLRTNVTNTARTSGR